MATLSQLVTYQLAQTEQDLQSEDGLADYASIKQAAIDRAKDEFYGSNVPSEGSIDQIVLYHLSDKAVVYLIDTAIDWYQSRTVKSQSAGDDQTSYYDRINNLRQRRRELQQRIGDAADRVKALAFGLLSNLVYGRCQAARPALSTISIPS